MRALGMTPTLPDLGQWVLGYRRERPANLPAVVILAGEMFILGSKWRLLAAEQAPARGRMAPLRSAQAPQP